MGVLISIDLCHETCKSIASELFGFFLDISFLIILVPWFQDKAYKRAKFKEKSDFKLALRDQLMIFIFWSQAVQSQIEYDVLFSFEGLKKLTIDLKGIGVLTDVQPIFLRTFAEREIPTLEALTPIAASIDQKHFKKWILILNNLKGVRDSKTDEELCESIIDFLKVIVEFDELVIKI